MPYITLNKNNFFNNLDIIAKQTQDIDKIALVLKDNAYGHGILEVAVMAQEYGIKRAVVQNCQEAKQIAEYFEYVLVLADYSKEKCPKIRYTINDINSISSFAKGTKVELKVDTGMHRNGIAVDELYTAFARIKEHKLELEAIFTHHRSADELTSEWYWQNDVFKRVKKHAQELIKEFGFSDLRFHSCNSASLFRTENFDEDMVRVGIAAYGCMELVTMKVDEFKPVLSLNATKISSRYLKSGDRVGYGGTYEVDRMLKVSNYDFGYGTGFLRLSSSFKTPNGSELVGRISMDNSSFLGDEDELLVFDDARVAASFAKTISYEVLTSLKPEIKREIV